MKLKVNFLAIGILVIIALGVIAVFSFIAFNLNSTGLSSLQLNHSLLIGSINTSGIVQNVYLSVQNTTCGISINGVYVDNISNDSSFYSKLKENMEIPVDYIYNGYQTAVFYNYSTGEISCFRTFEKGGTEYFLFPYASKGILEAVK
jgi:hypothetical protein